MKLKSLILGSVAAAGLSTAGFAADLGVLTSLDVCDELGLSGLTISSDTNCLQITGEVQYNFTWGNYNGSSLIVGRNGGDVSIDVPSDVAVGSDNDWESRTRAWLKFVGTANSDFGPASAVLKLKYDDRVRVRNGGQFDANTPPAPAGNFVEQRESAGFAIIDEAYVQVGDTTVLTAGRRGSIFNDGDDTPFNYTGLFVSEINDSGVISDGDFDAFVPKRGGTVIQLWTNIGEGLIAKIGLENLNSDDDFDGVRSAADETLNARKAGTLVGVLDYAGSGVTAHLSGAYGGLLDGELNNGDTYLVHTGATATFDAFRVRAALAFNGRYNPGTDEWDNFFNGLVTGEATFDMFKVALSGEVLGGNDLDTDYGFGGSVGATVAEGIEINLGGRYFNNGSSDRDSYQVAAQVVAALTESIKVTGEVGVFGVTEGNLAGLDESSDFYGKAALGWTPVGGNFSSTVGATVQQNGAYKVTFEAKKSFQ